MRGQLNIRTNNIRPLCLSIDSQSCKHLCRHCSCPVVKSWNIWRNATQCHDVVVSDKSQLSDTKFIKWHYKRYKSTITLTMEVFHVLLWVRVDITHLVSGEYRYTSINMQRSTKLLWVSLTLLDASNNISRLHQQRRSNSAQAESLSGRFVAPKLGAGNQAISRWRSQTTRWSSPSVPLHCRTTLR